MTNTRELSNYTYQDNQYPIALTEYWDNTKFDGTHDSFLQQGKPIIWHGAYVQNIRLSLGFSSSSPSTISIVLLSSSSYSFDNDVSIEDLIEVPIGNYMWYGFVTSIDIETEGDDIVITINAEDIRSRLNTILCSLNGSLTLDVSGVDALKYKYKFVDAYKLAKDKYLDRDGYVLWSLEKGMPWGTFKRAVECGDFPSYTYVAQTRNHVFDLYNKNVKIKFHIPDSITNLNSEFADLWLHQETGTLEEIITDYLEQWHCIWYADFQPQSPYQYDTQSKSRKSGTGLDCENFILHIYVIYRGSDQVVTQNMINEILNFNEIVYDANRINNVYKVLWGTELRRDPVNTVMLGAKREFTYRYLLTKNKHFYLPDSDNDIKSLYNTPKTSYKVIPFYGYIPKELSSTDKRGEQGGITIKVINDDRSDYEERRIAVQPFIYTNRRKTDYFYLKGAIRNHSPYIDATNPTGKLGQAQVGWGLDPLFYYLMSLNDYSEDSFFGLLVEILNPDYNGKLLQNNTLISTSAEFFHTIQSIWQWLIEPLKDANLLFPQLDSYSAKQNEKKIGKNSEARKGHGNTITKQGKINKKTQTRTENSTDTKHIYAFVDKDVVKLGQVQKASLTEFTTRFSWFCHELERVKDTIFKRWIIVSPQNYELQIKTYNVESWSSNKPNHTLKVDWTQNPHKVYAVNEGWPFSKFNDEFHLPVDDNASYSYDIDILNDSTWRKQYYLWGITNPNNLKMKANAAYYLDAQTLQTYISQVQEDSGNTGLDFIGQYIKNDKYVLCGTNIEVNDILDVLIKDYNFIYHGGAKSNIVNEYITLSIISLDEIWEYYTDSDLDEFSNIKPYNLLDNNDYGYHNFPICPVSLFIPFQCDDLYYGPFGNDSVEIINNEYYVNHHLAQLLHNEDIAPWSFKSEKDMNLYIKTFLLSNKFRNNNLPRIEIHAYDWFRPIGSYSYYTGTTPNSNLQIFPGLPIYKDSDSLLSSLETTFGNNGWEMSLSFVSYLKPLPTFQLPPLIDVHKKWNILIENSRKFNQIFNSIDDGTHEDLIASVAGYTASNLKKKQEHRQSMRDVFGVDTWTRSMDRWWKVLEDKIDRRDRIEKRRKLREQRAKAYEDKRKSNAKLRLKHLPSQTQST